MPDATHRVFAMSGIWFNPTAPHLSARPSWSHRFPRNSEKRITGYEFARMGSPPKLTETPFFMHCEAKTHEPEQQNRTVTTLFEKTLKPQMHAARTNLLLIVEDWQGWLTR
jgi:hypothetical protein